MNELELRRIVAGGEDLRTEFKRASSKHSMNDRDLVEAVMCQANGGGGILLLGVEDDGVITGASPRHGSITDPGLIAALVVNRTEPPTSVSVEVVAVAEGEVIVIDVPASTTPVGTKDGVFKRRSLKMDGTPECVPYRPHEMISAGLLLSGRDYAGVLARDVRMHDLDPDEFRRFRGLCQRGAGDRSLSSSTDLEILRALRLLGPREEMTLGALLLFGTTEALAHHVPSAEILFHELDRGRIVTDVVERLPLFAAADRLYSLLDSRNPEQEVQVGLRRVAVPRMSNDVMRELIANALVHRDYAELGPVRVQLAANTLRISSPGGFPPGVTLDNLLVESRPRSVILADAFKRAGIVDRVGRGIPNVFEALLRAGRGEPDYRTSTSQGVAVSLSTSDSDLEMVRFVIAYEEETGSALALEQLRVLYELKDIGPSSISELRESLRMDESAIRTTAARLAEAGLVEVRGNGRNRRFHLAAAFARTAEDRTGRIRVLRPDEIQMQRMILDYVDSYGTITRGQAADLCIIDPLEARRLLLALTQQGALELRGERRGAHYVKASDA